MGVGLVRIDNRLVHGQVVEAWVPHLKSKRIVVADNDSAADPLKRAIIELAAPSGVRLDVVTVEEAARMFQSHELDNEAVLVLFAGPCQAYAAFMAGFTFDRLNVGNVHYAEGKTRMTPSVCVNRDELDVLGAMARAGVRVEIQAVPRDLVRPFFRPDEPSPRP